MQAIKAVYDGANFMLKQPVTAELLQTLQEQIKSARQEQKPVSAEDVTAAMMGMVGQALELDDKSKELFRELAQHIFVGQKNNNLTSS